MPVCPYYGKSEEYCDVGADYISPHDAEAISHFCSCRYQECDKFQELASLHPEGLVRQRASVPSARPASPVVRPHQPPSHPPIRLKFRNKWPLSFRLRYISSRFHSIEPLREEITMTNQPIKNRGWTVVLAGTGINLALGILYTWSIFKGAIADSIAAGEGIYNWDAASINDPYAVACLAFAASMILAGKCQDKLGPKVTAILGGLMVAAGFIWISQSTSYWAWVAGFGVLAGTGIGFGYSSATPPALKWFSPAKTGMIAGIVVSGFGLASVYIAPLAKYMLAEFGLQQSMMYFGIAFAIIVSGFAMFISNPPEGFVADPKAQAAASASAAPVTTDLKPSQLFKSGKFYALWLCFFIGSGAGLMVIGSAKGLAKASLGEMAFLVVVVMSIGNAAGRLVAGGVSDKIGRANTLFIMLAFQALLMFAAIPVLTGGAANPILVTLLVTGMVFNYGTNLALFPSFTKDFWGMKHFGMNYGLVFSAWGVGAFALVRISEMLKVKTGSMEASFIVAAVLLLVGAMMALSLKPKKVAVEVPEAVTAEEEDLVLQEARD